MILLLLDIDYLHSLKGKLYSTRSPIDSCYNFIGEKIVENRADTKYHETGQSNGENITISLVDKNKNSFYGIVFELSDYQEFIWDTENIHAQFNRILEVLGEIDTSSNDRVIGGLELLRSEVNSQLELFNIAWKTIDDHITQKTPAIPRAKAEEKIEEDRAIWRSQRYILVKA